MVTGNEAPEPPARDTRSSMGGHTVGGAEGTRHMESVPALPMGSSFLETTANSVRTQRASGGQAEARSLHRQRPADRAPPK